MLPLSKNYAYIDTASARYVLHPETPEDVHRYAYRTATKTAFPSEYAARAAFLALAQKHCGIQFAVR